MYFDNVQVPPNEVSVRDAIFIGENMAYSYRNCLPSGFHGNMSREMKTMEHLKRGMIVGEKRVFYLETIFLRLHMVGQKRQLQLAPISQHELYTITPSLIDENGYLRKRKYILVNRLGLEQVSAPAPGIAIVEMQQMLYHIIWPHGENVSDVSGNIERRLSCYSAGTEQVLLFDRFDDLSAKDHETMQRAGEGHTDYNLTANSPLPNLNAIRNNTHNKRVHSRVLSLFNIDPDVTMDSRDDGAFTHDEHDVTMIAYMLKVHNLVRIYAVMILI